MERLKDYRERPVLYTGRTVPKGYGAFLNSFPWAGRMVVRSCDTLIVQKVIWTVQEEKGHA